MTRGRRILWLIVLIFVIYTIYNAPTEAAGIAKGIVHLVGVAIQSLFSFFDALLKK